MSNSENNHPHDTQGINTLKRDSFIRLVDDDPSVLRALTTFLQMDDWQVRCFKSGIDFLHTPGKEPGCVILDVRMPGLSGLEVQDLMKKKNIPLPVIFLSAHGDIELAVDAVRKGAKTFLEKPPKPDKLLSSIEEAVQAHVELLRAVADLATLEQTWNTLTAAEQQVAGLVAKGLTNSVIASVLGVSENTIRAHRSMVNQKLDTENAVEVSDFIHEMEKLQQISET